MVLRKYFFDAGGRWPQLSYWIAITLFTGCNMIVLVATSAVAGLTLDSYMEGSPAVAVINMIAFTSLLWPGLAITLRRLDECKNGTWWGLVIYIVAVFVFMITFFGKPFEVGALPTAFNLLPTILFVILSAWLVVEFLVIRRPQISNE